MRAAEKIVLSVDLSTSAYGNFNMLSYNNFFDNDITVEFSTIIDLFPVNKTNEVYSAG